MYKTRLRPEDYPAIEELTCNLCGNKTPFLVETATRFIKQSGLYMLKCIICGEYIFLSMPWAMVDNYEWDE